MKYSVFWNVYKFSESGKVKLNHETRFLIKMNKRNKAKLLLKFIKVFNLPVANHDNFMQPMLVSYPPKIITSEN